MSDIAKYENPDERCRYPFDPSPAGYCWSFAHHVDGNPKYADILSICRKCEFWKEADHA